MVNGLLVVGMSSVFSISTKVSSSELPNLQIAMAHRWFYIVPVKVEIGLIGSFSGFAFSTRSSSYR